MVSIMDRMQVTVGPCAVLLVVTTRPALRFQTLQRSSDVYAFAFVFSATWPVSMWRFCYEHDVRDVRLSVCLSVMLVDCDHTMQTKSGNRYSSGWISVLATCMRKPTLIVLSRDHEFC